MTSIQPELWVDRGVEAVTFYQAAFGATVLHRVGDGEDIVAQLAIGGAAFWVSTAGSADQRIHPKAIGGATSRTLLIVDDPEAVFHHAVTAGATPTAPPANEHGWRLARITDPFGHQWENRAPPRHLAATPTLATTGTWRMPAQPAVPSARRSPGSAPTTDGGVIACIAKHNGGYLESSADNAW